MGGVCRGLRGQARPLGGKLFSDACAGTGAWVAAALGGIVCHTQLCHTQHCRRSTERASIDSRLACRRRRHGRPLLQALRKATYKPAAFFKGLLLPLCSSGTCTLREAVIFTSVLRRTSIPVLHSAAALLRIAGEGPCRRARCRRSQGLGEGAAWRGHMVGWRVGWGQRRGRLDSGGGSAASACLGFTTGSPSWPPAHTPASTHSHATLPACAEMPYSGTNSFFIRVLLDKKYALPYRVIDALVDHFTRFKGEERLLPVVWHHALLCFVQRWAGVGLDRVCVGGWAFPRPAWGR